MLWYLVAVLLTVASYAAVGALLSWRLAALIAAIVAACILCVSAYRMWQFREGGHAVADLARRFLCRSRAMLSRRAQAAECGGRDVDRLGSRGPAGVPDALRRRSERPGCRVFGERGGHRGDPWRGRKAVARRAAGGHGPRVQPHPERRHGAQPAPRRTACGSHLAGRAGRSAGVRRGPGAARCRQGGYSGGVRRDVRRRRCFHRLSRDARLQRDPGGRVAPARAPRRRGERAVHAQRRCHRGCARLDPRASGAHGGAGGARPQPRAHVLRAGDGELVRVCDPSADRRAHPPRASPLPARRLSCTAPRPPARGRGARWDGKRGQAHARGAGAGSSRASAGRRCSMSDSAGRLLEGLPPRLRQALHGPAEAERILFALVAASPRGRASCMRRWRRLRASTC